MNNNQYENIDSDVHGSSDTDLNDRNLTETSETETSRCELSEYEPSEREPSSDGGITDTEQMQKGRGSVIYNILSSLYDYVEIFALSIIAVIFIFSFCVRLCRVDGSSMNQTLVDSERIIVSDIMYTPKQGDIIVFHLSNGNFSEPLVKRVIATEGQSVELNFTTGEIRVDGAVYADEHAYVEGGKYKIKYEYDRNFIVEENGMTYFRAEVPEGKLFVLGDNRNGSSDSRSERVGFVDTDCVLGKAIVRLKPFTLLGN